MEKVLLSKIMKHLEDTVYIGINEQPELFPIFILTSKLITCSSDYNLNNMTDNIYEGIIWEVINYLR